MVRAQKRGSALIEGLVADWCGNGKFASKLLEMCSCKQSHREHTDNRSRQRVMLFRASSTHQTALAALCRGFLGLVMMPVHSIAEEPCQYPSTFGAMVVAPQNRLGEFSIPLQNPDYREPRSVQQHLVFATVWARFLRSELRRQTENRCSAVITH
jgi:hypothetical protein